MSNKNSDKLSAEKPGQLFPVVIFLIAGMFLAGCTYDTDGQHICPVDLRCEYLKNPLGVDTFLPRLSWKTNVSKELHPFRQSAYRIVASTSEDKLDLEDFDAWDTGKQESNKQHLVPWNGINLAAGDPIFWKIRVWDQKGNPSAWSRPGTFTMGPMCEQDWTGDWIGYPYPDGETEDTTVLFRKEFTVDNTSLRSVLHIVVDGIHELYVNGERCGHRVLSPMLSSKSRLRYVSYDITSLLKKELNSIGVALSPGYFRQDKQRHVTGNRESFEPLFRLQLRLEGQPVLSSDNTWLCTPGNSSICNNDPRLVAGQWWMCSFGGEWIDAGKKDNSTLFSERVSDRWKPVEIKSAPGKTVTSEMAEPDRIHTVLEPVSVKEAEYKGRKAWRIDFGRNFTGFLDLEIEGVPGSIIEIMSSDMKDRILLYGQKSRLTLNQSGKGHFKHRFNFCAGRYLTLSGALNKPEPSCIRALAVSNDRKQTGHFKCSDSLLNQIFETDLWTYLSNTFNCITVDCPHRERRGYGMEGGMANIMVGLNAFESGGFFTKWLEDWRDVQHDNGYFPHCAPRDDAGGGPLWSSAPVFLAWHAYLHYRDKRLLEKTWPAIRNWLEFLHSRLENGVLPFYEPRTGVRGLGDWARPHPGKFPAPDVPLEEVGKRYEPGPSEAARHYNNCAYAWNLQLAIREAETLGKTEDAGLYRERLRALRKAVHRKYYNPQKKVYLDTDQMRQAFPLFTGIPPDSLRDDVLESFLKDITGEHPYFDTGNATPLLIKILTGLLERQDLVFHILLREEYPGYANLLKNGATTWPEYWDFHKSQIHTTYTGITAWFINGLGGIRPDPENPGFQLFLIKPYFAPGLDRAETSHESVYGKIISEWHRQDGKMQFSFAVPANSTARITVPFRSAQIKQIQGPSGHQVKWEQTGKSISECSLPSGYYSFTTDS